MHDKIQRNTIKINTHTHTHVCTLFYQVIENELSKHEPANMAHFTDYIMLSSQIPIL